MADNEIYAHIFGRRKKGNREEAKLLLFTADGTPFVPGSGSGGPPGTLTDLADVTGTPGIGKAPVSDESGEFPLTEVATQAYVDQQVNDALSRWAVLGHKLTFVTELSGLWTVTNSTVRLTPDGIVYGPYADGAVGGGSIRFHGMDGLPFSAVRNLAFHMRYTADKTPTEPFSRVFTVDADGNAHNAIFTPATQAYTGLGPGPFQEWLASAGTWRYDDDPGEGFDSSFDDIKAAHGDDIITSIGVTLGFSGGQNLTGLLRSMQINGNRYTFGN
ncbi:MAG: hypothetical protein ACJ8BW_02090 [Ktedonobacteraceae bacterium]|jgi:hypothetical protein